MMESLLTDLGLRHRTAARDTVA